MGKIERPIELRDVISQSKDVVTRQIEDEYILIPLTEGIGNIEEFMFSMNPVGKNIWDLLDGEKEFETIVDELIVKYDISKKEALKDVIGFIEELLKRNLAFIKTHDT